MYHIHVYCTHIPQAIFEKIKRTDNFKCADVTWDVKQDDCSKPVINYDDYEYTVLPPFMQMKPSIRFSKHH